MPAIHYKHKSNLISPEKIFTMRKFLFFGLLIALANTNLLLAQKGQDVVDTRIDNMGYWGKMAEKGLVPVAPVIPVKPAQFTSSKIEARSVLTENSTDVPVTSLTNVTESENSVFIDPNNADYILNSNNSTSWSGGSVGSLYGANYFQSANGGSTWGGSPQGAGGTNSGDPTTAINRDGRQFVGYISSSSGQGVSYSDDGSTWNAVTVAPNPGSLADKNHMWIDNSLTSSYQGNLYNAWTPFGGTNDAEIVISRSTNNGLNWSTAVNISSAVSAGSHNQGVNIQTGPNGEVYVAWAIYDSWPSDETAIGFAKSTNGGISYNTASRIISNIRGIRTTETSKNHRVNSFPSMAVDISGGANNGNLYIVWANVGVPGTNTGTNISVYCSRSTNGGTNWSTPVRVNQNPFQSGKEAYFPWITCDGDNGTLSVIFYDDRNTSSTSCEVFCANSFDGGLTWEDFAVSDVFFTPSPIPGLASGYMGDYLGITAKGGKVYPCWTDNRGGLYMTYVSPYLTNNLERPNDLTAMLNDLTGQVDLSWNFSTVPGFLYFNVYRDGILLETTTSTVFTDYLPDYGLYEYQVSAQHTDGESLPDTESVQWGDPGIGIDPASFYVTLPPDAQTTEVLTISNTGELDLTYSVTTIINNKGTKAYCSASGGCDEYISRVVFNTIDNYSGCSGYADYTAISTTVNAGDSYNLTIENGNVYSADDLGVWIDWNQDEDFDDAGENVVCGVNNGGYGTFSVTIPTNAVAGSTTMRIRMKWSGSDCGSPCGTTTYGEVEDYSINVVGWLLVNPVSGTITAGNSQQLNVLFDATDLTVGTYTADIIVSSNDPDTPSITVPATLNVSIGNPQISVSPSSIDFGYVQVGLTGTLQFSIENTGTGVLAGTISTPAGFDVSNDKGSGENIISFAVNEGITEFYNITFAPSSVQYYSGDVVIDHNAGSDPEIITVTGNGTPGPQPDIAFDPASLYVMLLPDNSTDKILQISNMGDAALTFSSLVSYNEKSSAFNPSLKTGYATKNFKTSKSEELSPFVQVGNSVPEVQGDILMDMDIQTITGDDQLLGCEFDGTYLWFSGAGGTSGAYPNNLYKIDVSGNLVATYSQGTTSSWGIRDMAFDGTNLFGGDENGFYQINPITGAVTTLFSGNLGLTAIRTLAYYPETGNFLASNWDTQIIEFTTSGTQVAAYAAPGLTGMYGMAYDEFTGNLWLYDRTGSPATSFYEYNISTQALTGVSIQVPLLSGLTDQLNGGAFFTTSLVPGKIVLGGVVQGTNNDKFFAMELGDLITYSWLSVTDNGSGTVPGNGTIDVTVHFNAAGLSYGIYTGNIEISSNDPYDPVVLVPCTLEVVSGITVNLKAMLEGPFSGGTMMPWLNIYGSLPYAQPYNSDPWNYNGSESVEVIPNADVVDWILVELRETPGDASTATPSTAIASQAGFILLDGTIVNTTGILPMSFGVDVADNLFAVIIHRNHLNIMSSSSLPGAGGIFSYDFSNSLDKVYGGIHGHKELQPGVWGMISGDGDADGEVMNQDKNDIWQPSAGNNGYLQGDFNMNNSVNDEDSDLYWAPNAGKGTKIVDETPEKGYSSMVPK
jgi:hypothetical protein